MTEQKVIPHHVLVAQLEQHPAFKKFCERAKELIEMEKEKFWKIDKEMAEAQRAKVDHFQEFWGGLMVYIKNAQNHPNK
jgi:chromatin segregation and condensation protein Rec8/ScpA/Scc1 (kleisin family)